MPRCSVIRAVLLPFVFAAWPLSAVAGGVIQGYVANAFDTAKPLVQARVTVEAPAIGLSRATTTDAEGKYRFEDLPPATYSVRVLAKQFKPMQRDNIPLRADRGLRVNLELLPEE